MFCIILHKIIRIIMSRITDPKTIDYQFLETELNKGIHITLQFSRKVYSNQMLNEIDLLCKKYNDNLCIRFYSHDTTGFDVNTVLKIPHVKNLYFDCLKSAKNIKALSELENLSELCIGTDDLDDLEFLKYKNLFDLKALSFWAKKSKKISLEPLANYSKLTELNIDEHTKHIEAIGNLVNLKKLYLRAIKKVSLEFINEMKSLDSLKLLLGGRSNINEIDRSEIKHLSIDWVVGLNNIDSIFKLPKLEKLSVFTLKQLQAVNITEVNETIKDLMIADCKNLNKIEGLNKLEHLTNLWFSRIGIDFEELKEYVLTKSLEFLDYRVTSDKRDNEIKLMTESMGYKSARKDLF